MTDNEPFPIWMVPNGTTWTIVDFGGELAGHENVRHSEGLRI